MPTIVSPTAALAQGFYTQTINFRGLPILGSNKVEARALQTAYEIVGNMIGSNQALIDNLVASRTKVVIIGASETDPLEEKLTDLPEFTNLRGVAIDPTRTWDITRGAGGPNTATGEENLLKFANDSYRGQQSILVHEFAHTIMLQGWANTLAGLDAQWTQIYTSARAAGLWNNTYAGSNRLEYFAELTQIWFNFKPEGPAGGNGVFNDINTRAKLQVYDPQAYAFLNNFYRADDWKAGAYYGSDAGDQFAGSGNADVMLGLVGNDAMNGGQGNDIMEGGAGADTMDGGAGADILDGGLGADSLVGDIGNDVLTGDGILQWTANAGAVRRLYLATFNRGPDDTGWLSWSANLDAGQTLNATAAGFVGSQEFLNTYGANQSNEAFVTLLYRNVLKRDPDAGGLAANVNALNGGTSRATIVTGLSESAEFKVTSDYEIHAGQVYRLYGATLARAPDAGGFETWTNGLAGGQSLVSIAAGFVNSAEFQTKYGNQDSTGFVTLLYQNVLGRAPDAGGLNFWRGQLDTAAQTRTQVVTGFSESAEYINGTLGAARGFVQTTMTDWNDTIVGGAGEDLMSGGRGSDLFVFNQGQGGNDQVFAFEAYDRVQFTGFGYANAAAALARMTQQGDTVVFNDQGQVITFHEARLADMAYLLV